MERRELVKGTAGPGRCWASVWVVGLIWTGERVIQSNASLELYSSFSQVFPIPVK